MARLLTACTRPASRALRACPTPVFHLVPRALPRTAAPARGLQPLSAAVSDRRPPAAPQPISAGGASNKAQKGVVNKQKKKKQDSDDEDDLAFKQKQKEQKEKEKAMADKIKGKK